MKCGEITSSSYEFYEMKFILRSFNKIYLIAFWGFYLRESCLEESCLEESCLEESCLEEFCLSDNIKEESNI